MEGLAVGKYVVIRGQQTGRQFFGLITDIGLDATNPDIAKTPPDMTDDFLATVYAGQVAFGTMHVSPMLVLDANEDTPKPGRPSPPISTATRPPRPTSTASLARKMNCTGTSARRSTWNW